MMAVEVFVYLYIAAFAGAVLIGAFLLVTAARYIGSETTEKKPVRGEVRQPEAPPSAMPPLDDL